MERLLTPIVTRLLQSYVKSAQGKTGADLRVVLTGGTLALHSLELNLDPLLRKFPFLKVHRAYAERLRLVIPWTSLATQPIQVRSSSVGELEETPSQTTFLPVMFVLQIWLDNVTVVAEVKDGKAHAKLQPDLPGDSMHF